MVGQGEKDSASCRRTEQETAVVCAVGENTDSDTCVQMGTGTETDTDTAGSATASVRGDNGEGSKGAEHADCKRRRVYKSERAAAGDTGG